MKLSALALIATGYVLGARAGQARYEQIVTQIQNASERLEAYSAGHSPARRRWSPAADSRAARSERESG